MEKSVSVTPSCDCPDWFARLHSGRCSPEEERAFLEWLDKNPQHISEYRKCLQAWEILGNVPENAFVPTHRPLWQRREVMAAALSLLCAGGVFLATNRAVAKVYRTGVGEQRRITLRDGSDVILDTDSCLKFSWGVTTRCAEILRGRVSISAAPEGRLPLLVRCGRWNISTQNGEMDLYTDRDLFSAYFRGGHGTLTSSGGISRELLAGERMRASARKLMLDHPDPVVMRAWQAGQLVFKNISLASAVRQMNRYSKTKIHIDDPAAAALHISGVYRAGKCQRFARTVAVFLPVRTWSGSGVIHIASKA